jgi:hypothetical protein
MSAFPLAALKLPAAHQCKQINPQHVNNVQSGTVNIVLRDFLERLSQLADDVLTTCEEPSFDPVKSAR